MSINEFYYADEDGRWCWKIPEFFNIAAACTDLEKRSGIAQKEALIVEQQDGAVDVIRYGDLDEQVRMFAGVLQSFGLGSQSRVLIRLPNSVDYPVVFLGVLYSGNIAVPSSTMLTIEEVAYLANDSQASVLVVHQSDLSSLNELLEQTPDVRQVLVVKEKHQAGELPVSNNAPISWLDEVLGSAISLERPVKTKASDPAYLVYTSGTTGYPKGVLHAHRALIGRQPASHHWFDFSDGDERILHSGKFNWTYVLGTAMMDPFSHGKTVVVYEGESRSDLWPELIAKHQCTVFIGVPTIYRQIIQKTDFNAADVPSLKHCMSAGEHLSDEMLSLWRERFECDIHEALGMSECSYYMSHPKGKQIVPGAAGLIQPGHQVALLDEQMRPVKEGEEGMLCISESDPGLCIEYWRLPEETSKSREAGYFLTGDYARKDERGYVWFSGRKDDIINSFGYRISPIEIERVLKSHEAIADCVVMEENVGHDKDIVSAFVILVAGEALSEQQVITFAAAHLAKYKVPKRVRIVKEFPRTRNGKVLRKALKASLYKSENCNK